MDKARFKNRQEAAKLLADLLKKYQQSNTIVLGVPRGGIVTAKVIADKLSLPLGLIIVRKIGHPYNPEYAIAAITESGLIIKNEDEAQTADSEWLHEEAERQSKEAQRRRMIYWGNKDLLTIKNKTVIIVDDGLATGFTMSAAIKEVKLQNPKKIIVAVPVSPKDTAEKIKSEVDDFVAVLIPEAFLGAVGAYYESFPQIKDQEIIDMLDNGDSPQLR